jgi:hypothetical protein
VLKTEHISKMAREDSRSVCVTGPSICTDLCGWIFATGKRYGLKERYGTLSIWRRAQVQELRDLPATISGLGLLHSEGDGILLHEGMLLSGAAAVHACDER